MAVFHSVKEVKKSDDKRVHHNNNKRPSGYDIPKKERVSALAGIGCAFTVRI
jgi:hypothetical protein